MPYPVPPGPRIPYDSNGSILLMRPADQIVREVAAGSAAQMNSERANFGFTYGSNYEYNYGKTNVYTTGGANHKDQYFALLFPVPMRLYAIFCPVHAANSGAGSSGLDVDLYTAPDTTNGDDGTWSFLQKIPKQIGSTTGGSATTVNMLMGGGIGGGSTYIVVNDVYRRPEAEGGYTPLSGTFTRHVRGIKLVAPGTYYGNYWKLHIYGEPDTDSTDNILIFYEPDEESTAKGDLLDWGDVPQGSTADKTFRLKNNSAAQTAYDIVINAQMGLTTTDPIPSDSLLFSMDGNTWTKSVTLAALSPGAMSGQIQVRRTTPLNAQPSNWAPRVVATVGSWS
jgi:hypothetical protein